MIHIYRWVSFEDLGQGSASSGGMIEMACPPYQPDRSHLRFYWLLPTHLNFVNIEINIRKGIGYRNFRTFKTSEHLKLANI